MTNNRWTYAHANGVEQAIWTGRQFPGLRPHLHSEIQTCEMIKGTRVFEIAGTNVTLQAGELLYIPSYLPHTAIPQSARFMCRNFYYSPDPKSSAITIPMIAKSRPDLCMTSCEAVTDHFATSGRVVLKDTKFLHDDQIVTGSVALIAQNLGLSREHYSRRFKRVYGLSPINASLALRGNEARCLLRKGAKPGDVAYQSGFADQSHLTRNFLTLFGTTPAAYARAVACHVS